MAGNVAALSNEILLILLAFSVLSVSLLRPERTPSGRIESTIAAAGLLVLIGGSFAGLMPRVEAFGGVWSVGPATVLFKRIFLSAGLVTVLLSWPTGVPHRFLPRARMGEYLGLLLFSLAGMCLLSSAREVTLLYTGLELTTIPLIGLVAFKRKEARCAEAGMKYVFTAALSSGLLLYGLSLLYGMTGTTFPSEIAGRLSYQPLTVIALAMIVAGVGFKISAVPFHLWTPDTYEGAPVTVTAFLSVASKAAGFMLFYQLLMPVLNPFQGVSTLLLALLATVTMTFGNLVALHQTRLKRFLAYSSIAQAGYLLLGMAVPGEIGAAAVQFYLVVYLFSNLAAFAVVALVFGQTGHEDLRDYPGFSQTNPGLALVMMLAMFSLAGIPPLAGFLGKFYLFAAAASGNLYWLVFVGAANATISLYYYLVVIKWMYIVPPAEGQEPIPPLKVAWPGQAALLITTAAMLLFGIVPQAVDWIEKAAAAGF